MSLLNRTFALALAWALATATYAQPPQAEGGGVKLKVGDRMLTVAKETPWRSKSGEQGTLPCGVHLVLTGAENSTTGEFVIPGRSERVLIDTKNVVKADKHILELFDRWHFPDDLPTEMLALATHPWGSDAEATQQLRELLTSRSPLLRQTESSDLQASTGELNRQLAKATAIFGEDNYIILIKCFESSIILMLDDKWAEAEPLSGTATRIARTYFFDGHPLLLQTHILHAKILVKMGRFEDADKCLDDVGTYPDQERLIQAISLRLEIARGVNSSSRAIVILQNVFNQLRKLDLNTYKQAMLYTAEMLGHYLESEGRTQQAEEVYTHVSNAISEDKTPDDVRSRVALGAIKDNLALILAGKRLFDEALRLNSEATEIFTKLVEGGENDVKMHLSIAMQQRSRILLEVFTSGNVDVVEEIKTLCLRSVSLAAGLSSPDVPTELWRRAMQNTGFVFFRIAQECEYLADHSEDADQRQVIAKMAASYYKTSRESIDNALGQSLKLDDDWGTERFTAGACLYIDASLACGEDKDVRQMATLTANSRIERVLREAMFATEGEAASLFGHPTSTIVEHAITLSVVKRDKVYSALSSWLNLKARRTDSRVLANHRLQQVHDAELVRLGEVCTRGLKMSARGISRVAYAASGSKDSWSKAFDEVERGFIVPLRSVLRRAELDFIPELVSIDNVRNSVPSNTAFIDYFPVQLLVRNSIGGQKYAKSGVGAFIMLPNTLEVHFKLLAPTTDISAAVERVRTCCSLQAIENAGDPALAAKDAADALKHLHTMTLEPFMDHLNDVEHIVISPEADLWFVPWAALPGRTSEFLTQDFTISLALSGRDLIRPQLPESERRQSAPALVLAAPNYNANQSVAYQQVTGKELPATDVLDAVHEQFVDDNLRQLAEQVRTSESILPPAQALANARPEAEAIMAPLRRISGRDPILWTGDAALEPALAEHTDSPQVLVFITHGFALGSDSPETAAPTSSGSEQRSVPQPIRTGSQNPLVNCGLLLAGCNARGNMTGMWDGILTGQEVLGMNLRQTELVVLSACETGLGTLQGSEGVAGLRQAFQLAGARSVLATLWTVDDLENKNLMVDFFDSYADSRDAAAALRSAQLKRIADLKDQWGAAHPYFWAAATVTGPPQREN